MRPLVIYHSPCADGAGAAYAAYRKFGDGAEYRPANYGDAAPLDNEVRGRDVFVLDFSYPRPELLRMRAAAGSLRVIDHHKTAREAFGDLDCAIFDMEHSGAVLAWRHFHGEVSVPEILLYIEDRDLWRWKMHASKEVSAALDARGVSRCFYALEDLVDLENLSPLMEEGEALLRQQQAQVDALVALARLRGGSAGSGLLGDGRFYYVVNTYLLYSEVGNVLAQKGSDEGFAPLAAVWYQMADGRYKVSLRSVGDCDVSAIAKKFRGGGHLNAASFYCDQLPWYSEDFEQRCSRDGQRVFGDFSIREISRVRGDQQGTARHRDGRLHGDMERSC